MIIFPEDKNSNFYSQKSMGSFLTAFVPFLFKQPIRLKNDSAYDLSDSIGLSFSDCKERFLYPTIPLAPAIKMCLLTTDLTLRSFFSYSQRDQCRIIPRGGLPRDASCREVQLPFSEFCSSLKYCFLINLTVDSFTSLINSLEKRLATLVYPYSQAHLAILALLSGVK